MLICDGSTGCKTAQRSEATFTSTNMLFFTATGHLSFTTAPRIVQASVDTVVWISEALNPKQTLLFFFSLPTEKMFSVPSAL